MLHLGSDFLTTERWRKMEVWLEFVLRACLENGDDRQSFSIRNAPINVFCTNNKSQRKVARSLKNFFAWPASSWLDPISSDLNSIGPVIDENFLGPNVAYRTEILLQRAPLGFPGGAFVKADLDLPKVFYVHSLDKNRKVMLVDDHPNRVVRFALFCGLSRQPKPTPSPSSAQVQIEGSCHGMQAWSECGVSVRVALW